MARNIFAQEGSWLPNVNAGIEAANAFDDRIRSRRASTRAAPMIASGDYQGAAGVYGEMGLADETMALEGQARTRQRQGMADERQAADDDRKARQEVGKLWVDMANNLRAQFADPQQRFQAFTQNPVARTLTPDQLAQVTVDDFTNEGLDAVVGTVKRELEWVKGPDGTWAAFDKSTAAPVAEGMTPTRPSLKQFDPEKPVVEVPGQPGMSSGVGAAAPASAGIAGPLRELEAMGVRVTSDVRTPERNRAVGGDPNSRHQSGQALDLAPPEGMTMAQLAQEAKRRFPQARVINEGDHIHVQWGAQRANPFPNAPRVVMAGQPKPTGRMATAEDRARLGLPENGSFWIDPDGKPSQISGTGDGAKGDRKAAADFRKEFNARPEVKEFRDVQTSYNQIRSLFTGTPSAAGDIAGVFSFMKLLDPGSVVREGEFATAQNAAGVPDIARNAYNRALSGQRLNPKQRADFLAQAEAIYRTRGQRYAELVGEYRGYARDYDIDPDQIAKMPQAPATRQSYPEAVNRAHAEAVRKGEYDPNAPLGDRRRPLLAATKADVDAADIPANRGKYIRLPDGALARID